MRRIPSSVLLSVVFSIMPAQGQSAPPASLDQVALLTDEFTVALGRLDLTRLNLDAAFDTLTDLASDRSQSLLPTGQVAPMKAAVKEWVTRFREAGGRDVYALFSLNDLGADPPVMVAVPMGEDGNVEAMRQLFVSAGLGSGGKCALLHHCLVAAPTPILRRLEKLETAPARNLQPAFAQTSPGLLQAVFLPYDAAGRVLDEVMPVLPSILGGGSSAALSRGLRWAALSATSPPELSVQLTIQARTGPDAEALRRTIQASLDAVGNLAPLRQAVPQWETLAAMLTPAVKGDRLVLAWDRSGIERLAKTIVMPALDRAKRQARFFQSVNNLKQIGLAVLMYANDHEDQLPSHLAAILPYLAGGKPLLLSDRGAECPPELMGWDYPKQVDWIDQHGAYAYLRPAATLKQIKKTEQTILAYQRVETTDGATVPAVFADGHVERLSREAFEKLLAKSRESSP